MAGVTGAVIALYGPAKAGKSVAAAMAATGDKDIVIAAPGAVDAPVAGLFGVTLPGLRAAVDPSLSDITKAVKSAEGNVVVDDLTLIVGSLLARTKSKGWSAFTDAENAIVALLDAGRSLSERGYSLILTFHEAPPRTGDKVARGGPALWGTMSEKVSARCDAVWRAVQEPESVPWEWVLESRSGAYVAGDRLVIMPDRGPMNVAEALRLSGRYCYRDAALSRIVEQARKEILDGGITNWRATIKGMSERLRAKNPDMTSQTRRLIFSDALDGARIILHRQNNTDFWDAPSTASSDSGL